MIKNFVWKRFQYSLSQYTMVMLLCLFQTTKTSVSNHLLIKPASAHNEIEITPKLLDNRLWVTAYGWYRFYYLYTYIANAQKGICKLSAMEVFSIMIVSFVN